MIFFFPILIFGQEKLKVEYNVMPYYESTNKHDIDIIAESSLFELISTKNESLYKYLPSINNSQTENSGTGIISATITADQNTIYKETSQKTYLEQAKIANKTFLLKEDLPKIEWVISKESKKIEDLPVYKATAILNDEYKTEIEAWYSPKLNFKTGPDKFWGLPGIILEVKTKITYEDGSSEGILYRATKVEIINSKIEIQKPKKGNIITKKEFDKLQNTFIEKQMEMFSTGVNKD